MVNIGTQDHIPGHRRHHRRQSRYTTTDLPDRGPGANIHGSKKVERRGHRYAVGTSGNKVKSAHGFRIGYSTSLLQLLVRGGSNIFRVVAAVKHHNLRRKGVTEPTKTKKEK